MRVEQRHEFLSDMLRAALALNTVPADFQRPYVWDSEHVTAMYRSLLKGWPIGAFVTWEPSVSVDIESVARGRLGPVRPEGTPERLLLDGQNRIATLVWTAFADGSALPGDDWSEAERATWMSGNILTACHATKTIEFVPAGEEFSTDRVPMKAILMSIAGGRDGLNTVGKAIDAGASDKAVRWYFDEVAGQIREARVTVTNLMRADIEDAREAFLHICRTGQPMSEEDFAAAVSWHPPSRDT